MFGVTTPCVTRARERLEELGYEVLVFHATGTGGQSFEALATGGYLVGALDATTTELADDLVGGVLSAGPDRLEAVGRAGMPQVVSLGALDMVNFGPRDTVPPQFEGRNLYVHNPTITLMRTTPEEMAELGRRIARKLNGADGPTVLFVPLKGVSAIDVEGQPFRDAEADEALFAALREGVDPGKVEVHEVDADVNDPAFATAMADRLHELIQEARMTRDEALARLREQVAAGPAGHRRRRGHGPVGQVRAGRRRRPDHHLQLRALPDGGPRLAGGDDALRRRQRDRHGHGPRGAAGRARHGGAGRRVRDRSVPAHAAASSRTSSARASPACRTSRPSGSSTGPSASAWRRPAWATASRSR